MHNMKLWTFWQVERRDIGVALTILCCLIIYKINLYPKKTRSQGASARQVLSVDNSTCKAPAWCSADKT